MSLKTYKNEVIKINYEILSLETAEKVSKYDKEQKRTPIDWNLDYELIVWLNKNLKVFYENASEVVDLTFHKFMYKGKEYTQEQLILKLIDITNYLKKEYFNIIKPKVVIRKTKEMFDILKLIFFTLWW